MHTIASFQGCGWCSALRHAKRRLARWSGSTFQTHFSSIQVWPNCSSADQVAALLSRELTISWSSDTIVWVGQGGGSFAKLCATSRGAREKKLCNRRSVTSLWMCTIPSGPRRDGTLDILCPCRQAATSQSWAFSMYSFAHFCFATLTVPLSLACALLQVLMALRRFLAAMAQAAFHYDDALGWNSQCLWNISLLVLWISVVSAKTSFLTSASVGLSWKGKACDLLLNNLIWPLLFSGSTTKLRSVSSLFCDRGSHVYL